MPDIRSYLQELEDLGHVARVARAVDLRHELAAAQWKIERQLFKTVLFENVQGHHGVIAGNLFLTPLRTGILPIIPFDQEYLSFYQGLRKPGIVYPVWSTSDLFLPLYRE